MYHVVIVDDEMIIRTTLHSMIDWQKHNFMIVFDAINGKDALKFLKQNHVDVLITDIKMPILDGIELLKQIKELGYATVTIVLSGYNDFNLVREAFKLGAYDYILKSDMNTQTLSNMMDNIYKILSDRKVEHRQTVQSDTKSEILSKMAIGKLNVIPDFFDECFYLVQFEIDNFLSDLHRFGNDLIPTMVQPMLNFAMQLPRVASKCVLSCISPSRYILYYNFKQSELETQQYKIMSICKQIINVWKNFMNISVSAGISNIGYRYSDFLKCVEECENILTLKYIKGRNKIYISNDFDIYKAISTKSKYSELICYLQKSDESQSVKVYDNVFSQLYGLDFENAKIECIYIIYQIAIMLKDINDDIYFVFQEDINYFEKLNRLDSMRSLEIWMTNYFRFVKDYIEHNYDRKQVDIIERAKRFICDNYFNPEISLGMVADFVGLNEKYFSSRFTKEVGNTFSNYLTELRIQKAKELLDKTDLKMYEISSKVGYNNVEHFIRVFKKVCDISPGAYRKL